MDIKSAITVVLKAVAIMLVLYVFEMTKAAASALQGDDLPKKNGMLTPNIFKYFEPIGFLLTYFFGYGWGKPAPVSTRNYKDRKIGTLVTHLSPILLSVLFAVVINIGYNLINNNYNGSALALYSGTFLYFLSQYFLRIAVFNLIPIPPMCGSEILKCFLSPNAAFQYGQNAPLVQMGFLFLWFFGLVTPLIDGVVAVVGGFLLG
ncbi:MAG: site-2 protease family protein [Firmicutes bacterium]|nr:site-2 protease family protein [Bacillota bacterium]